MSKKKLVVPIGFTVFFFWVVCHLIYEKNGDLVSGNANVWGDWAVHYIYTNHFALKPPALWFSQNPIFAGENLHYPFAANFLTSLLVRAGISVGMSLKVVSFLTMTLASWLFFFFFERTTGRGNWGGAARLSRR